MKIGYFDCMSGVSGDMLLGALVSCGVKENVIVEAIASLNLPGVEVHFSKVMRAYISATAVEIKTPQSPEERHLPELMEIVEKAALDETIKRKAKVVITRLAEVEARIHGSSKDHLHLHELGGDDTLADIVGVMAASAALGCEKWYCSPLPLGRGWGKSMHGALPLPAPATLALLEGIPIEYRDTPVELVTPTGAVLVTTLATEFGGFPKMTLLTTGWGAGGKDLEWPNVLRIWIGDTEDDKTGYLVEELEELVTSIDDLNPQIYDHVVERLFSEGALDVTITPQMMKKNRPAIKLEVLCKPRDGDTLGHILLEETTSLGFRRRKTLRWSLPREICSVETPYGRIRIKTARLDDALKTMPEYEDCVQAAREHHVPLQRVMDAARYSASKGEFNHE